MPHDVTLLRDIALGIVFAALVAHVARVIRQPLILGYIAGGVLLSPRLGLGLVTSVESIELISEIGLILLLFIIGLEIDLRELRRLGRSMLALGRSRGAPCSSASPSSRAATRSPACSRPPRDGRSWS